MEKFLEDIRNDLLQFLESPNEINNLIRYYLIKVVDASRPRQQGVPNPIDQPFESIDIGCDKIQYPFSITEENNIRNHLHNNYDNNISSVNKLNDMISSLNDLILNFNEELKRICDNDVKGNCSVEKASVIFKIKSFFHLC